MQKGAVITEKNSLHTLNECTTDKGIRKSYRKSLRKQSRDSRYAGFDFFGCIQMVVCLIVVSSKSKKVKIKIEHRWHLYQLKKRESTPKTEKLTKTKNQTKKE